MNIYLDIDGVLLINEKNATPHADEFIEYLLGKYPDSVYWLTTHNWNGENRCVELLAPHVSEKTKGLLEKIKPTTWKEFKTDAIDFNQDFRWLDDDLWPDEMKVLEDNNATGNFIMVDLSKDPEMLKKLIGVL